MARSSYPSIPPSPEPRLRRSSSSAGERPLRAQLVIASMLVLILIAVPFYLLRHPSGAPIALPDAGAGYLGVVVREELDASAGSSQVSLGPIQRVRCGAARGRARLEGIECDALPALEAGLRESIRDTIQCAPRTGKEGTINFVLEVDFAKNRLNLFPGQSGKWRGPQARRAALCALRSFPPVSWTDTPHAHDYYAIAVLATYPAPDPLEILPSFD